MPAKISINGKRFGRLIVTGDSVSRTVGLNHIHKKLYSPCLCDCGKQLLVPNCNLRSGITKSCGCLNREDLIRCSTTHGKSKTKTYNCWGTMIQRCTNPNNPRYKKYGGRGIKVCERWRKFENFYKDMGECPAGLTLERINNKTGNYEKSNCKWDTRKRQNRNKRNNRTYTLNGTTLCLGEICEIFGKNYSTVWNRLEILGWPIERALFDPNYIRSKS